MNDTTAAEFVVTECAAHGTKETSDYASMRVYVEIAREDDFAWVWHADGTITLTPEAARFHAENGSSPWRCCSHMVIDPFGIFDH